METHIDYEKLGVFYLGREADPKTHTPTENPFLYDARDLVTHAVCVGMTGSGKTGLCLSLLEEAAIDRVPAVIIDPKGDMGNLLLGFPELRAQDFRPWISADEAARKNLTEDALAEETAARWKKGLESWGQDGERIRRLHEAADFAIYTPGSEAGLSVSVLSSFSAPPAAVIDDADLLRSRLLGTASAVLGLLGIEADPLRSREHILISTLLQDAWTKGRDLDLTALILGIQRPPFERIGVFDIESFFPEKDRFELALLLNNLIASPTFGSWLEGEPLDIGRMLYTTEGKPRHCIFSIAHLSDAERMFFVTLLLGQVLSWSRVQSGTQSLRAIVYMDEVFGFFPPVANPPSKPPMLTLLKQARAFGVGIVLATQNPADLDYKGLANTGTWFIGRLQTERDRARLLDGLTGGPGASIDRDRWEEMLSGIEARTFVMHNVHDEHPVVFQSRWALSYLCGPLTLPQIRGLMSTKKPAVAEPVAGQAPIATAPQAQAPDRAESERRRKSVRDDENSPVAPMLPEGVRQVFFPAGDAGVPFHPHLLGIAELRFEDQKLGVFDTRSVALIAPLREGLLEVEWENGARLELDPQSLQSDPPADARFGPLPAAAKKAARYSAWTRSFASYVLKTEHVLRFRSPSQKLVSKEGEELSAFRARVAHAVREQKDEAVAKIRAGYGKKLAAIRDKLAREEEKLATIEGRRRQETISSVVDIGSVLLGSLFGRRASVSRVARGVGRSVTGASRASGRAANAAAVEERIAALQEEAAALERDLSAQVQSLGFDHELEQSAIESVAIAPKKTGLTVTAFAIAWKPAADA